VSDQPARHSLRRPILGLLALLLGSWLVATLWLMPIEVVIHRLPLLDGVVLSHGNGNLFRGRVTIQTPELTIDELHYRMRPSQLLTGRLSYALEARVNGGYFTADLAADRHGLVTLTHIHGRILAKSPLITNHAPFPLEGVLELTSERALLGPQGLIETKAQMVWLEAGLLFQELIPLGQISGEITVDAGQVNGQIRDDGTGVIAVDLQLTGTNRGRLTGTLAPRPNAPDWLAQSMSMLGRPDRQGRYPIQLNYDLPIATP